MGKRLSDEWREQAAKAEDRQLRNELRDPYGHGLEQKEVANTLAWVADQYDRRHPPGELDRMRAALQELEAWVSPPTGMGAGLHAEMWPHLTPAARKRLSEIVGHALLQNGELETESDERTVTWYSQGPHGDFETHANADEARAAVESMLEYYEDRAADDGWPEDIGDLEWGRLVPCEVARIEETPAPEGSGFDAHWDVTLVPYQPKKG